jgi:hypothetical protein
MFWWGVLVGAAAVYVVSIPFGILVGLYLGEDRE